MHQSGGNCRKVTPGKSIFFTNHAYNIEQFSNFLADKSVYLIPKLELSTDPIFLPQIYLKINWENAPQIKKIPLALP